MATTVGTRTSSAFGKLRKMASRSSTLSATSSTSTSALRISWGVILSRASMMPTLFDRAAECKPYNKPSRRTLTDVQYRDDEGSLHRSPDLWLWV